MRLVRDLGPDLPDSSGSALILKDMQVQRRYATPLASSLPVWDMGTMIVPPVLWGGLTGSMCPDADGNPKVRAFSTVKE